jgi:hypothetical protein
MLGVVTSVDLGNVVRHGFIQWPNHADVRFDEADLVGGVLAEIVGKKVSFDLSRGRSDRGDGSDGYPIQSGDGQARNVRVLADQSTPLIDPLSLRLG